LAEKTKQMTIQVIAEHDNVSLKAATLNTVAAAAVVATVRVVTFTY